MGGAGREKPRGALSLILAEATAAGQAAKFQQRGFTKAKALKGGVEAWKQAGYAIAA